MLDEKKCIRWKNMKIFKNLINIKKRYFVKKSYCNRFYKRYINKFYIGETINIYYILIFNKKRRYFSFLGMIMAIRYNSVPSFLVINTRKKEIIKIRFFFDSPSLFFIDKCYKYSYRYIRKKFYFRKKVKLTNFIFYKPKIISKSSLVEFSIYQFLMFKHSSLYKKSRLRIKRLKRLRKKFK